MGDFEHDNKQSNQNKHLLTIHVYSLTKFFIVMVLISNNMVLLGFILERKNEEEGSEVDK